MTIHLSTRPAPDLPRELDDFTGAWRFRRKIYDRKLGQESDGQGVLTFAPEGDGLIYHEVLTLSMPGQPPIEGSRRYRWRPGPRGIEVLFEDGRPFHQLGLGESRPCDLHPCGEDRYEVTYDFGDWPIWGATWEVRGPRKDYRMDTLYVREKSCR
ncbi:MULTISPECIES: DUF6314 family protein [unclassified Roseivivax]|uniref:DUF6314 family protein n=1 Tax=Roseivivax sp. GX 12232 TaxID=2900547 RepID=UPI001E5B420F|nr:DUF6314 family protein [Roseivivax sp. GX 12232]MCE0504561.1 DUF6314 family protein [Roseivivax sp. GX 12232]